MTVQFTGEVLATPTQYTCSLDQWKGKNAFKSNLTEATETHEIRVLTSD